ncbi:iron chelate uptake ABC transporter family permease subunit [Cryobacterium sp. SO2]|uniref:iron chelate uptake ABC transporter family permease subunit n=1 Tax=Cryobacterium sp. SO2 TaxID=1897060 RepID=UPI00223D836D|nr:iron chelate uptake ABC transporter family permease subunit [Cryobacterium sp. SO2]WEO76167.1 iron chelate uptake ABC transporter family permease subunit [Cryobacterium sp. SO2]
MSVRAAWFGVAGVALLVAITLSVIVGANSLAPGTVLHTVFGGGSAESRFVVWDQRIPRTAAALAVGAALGVAGALIQAFTRNPLADPGILGVNAGAAFCVAVGIAFFGVTSPLGHVWLACGGALILTVAVYAIGSAGGEAAGPVRLTVTGVAIGAVFAGLTTGLTLTNPDAFDRMRGWSAGSLLERGFDVVVPVLPLVLVGLALALAAAPGLNSIALGSDVARSQGVSVRRIQLVVLTAVTLLAGSATAVAGPLVFVGLVVPHVVRWTLGTDQRWILLGSLLLGPILVVLSDVLGRIAVLPSEMPVGIVTAFVGAPVLIALVRRRSATAL